MFVCYSYLGQVGNRKQFSLGARGKAELLLQGHPSPCMQLHEMDMNLRALLPQQREDSCPPRT